MKMEFDQLANLVSSAVAIAQHGSELVEQVTDSIERSKDAMSTDQLETLTQMLDQSHARTKVISDRLNAKLDKIANG